MLIALFGKKVNPKLLTEVNRFFKKVLELGSSVMIHKPFAEVLLQNGIQVPEKFVYYTHFKELPIETDILFSLGGDGTILDAILHVRDKNIPILGVNSGKLGFLTTVSIEEFSLRLDDIRKKNYDIENRSLLKINTGNISLFENDNFALNEFTIYKGESSSMITIHTYLNEDFLNSYWADGLIVATPTGSTAYSLSCGGPILVPETDNFVITPIAPHNLNVRPVVVSNNLIIRFKLEGRSEKNFISLDSRTFEINNETEIYVSKADFSIQLIRFKEDSFYKTLRNKLFWGIDKRN